MKKIFITLLAISAVNANAILVTGSCTPGKKLQHTLYQLIRKRNQKS